MRLPQRPRRSLVVAAVCTVLVIGVGWHLLALRPGRPFARLAPGTPVTMWHQDYWQTARLPQPLAAGVVEALHRVRGPGRPRPAGGGEAPVPRYVLSAGPYEAVFDPAEGTVTAARRLYQLDPLAQLALRGAAAAALASFGGRLVTWAEADRLFPLRADATVVDYETGLSFRVRRLAGRLHADVQPLTAADTAVMRRIYGGAWSWARRPVLVEVGGERLAASMNGMPHGAGSIPGNDFPGHFCIHFLLSEVHRSGRMDAGHLLAILAAAGVRVPAPAPPAPADGGSC